MQLGVTGAWVIKQARWRRSALAQSGCVGSGVTVNNRWTRSIGLHRCTPEPAGKPSGKAGLSPIFYEPCGTISGILQTDGSTSGFIMSSYTCVSSIAAPSAPSHHPCFYSYHCCAPYIPSPLLLLLDFSWKAFDFSCGIFSFILPHASRRVHSMSSSVSHSRRVVCGEAQRPLCCLCRWSSLLGLDFWCARMGAHIHIVISLVFICW